MIKHYSNKNKKFKLFNNILSILNNDIQTIITVIYKKK